MVTEKDVMDMYTHLRSTNSSISDEALDFMKETCLMKIADSTEIHTCTDFSLDFHDLKKRKKKITQPANGKLFTIQISTVN